MKIAIITSGFLPVPASKGGAVEALIDNIIRKNEQYGKLDIEIFSIYDEDAEKMALKLNNTTCQYIKPTYFVTLADKIVYFLAKNILKKKNTQTYRYIIQRLYFLNKVSKMLKKNDYDKVLLENHPTQYKALKWRKNNIKYSGRYYYHCHNEFPGTYGCEKIIKETKNIICVSNYIKRNISKYLEINNENVISVLTNCVDLNKFNGNISDEDSVELKRKFGIKENEKILLFTGRITPEKGVKELIEALKLVKNKNYKLLIVGSALNAINVKSIYQEEVEKIIENIKENVVFTGFIPYEQIPKIYALADIAVLPSMWDDPAPLTIIESMASGLPIITTKSGGIPEYVNEKCSFTLERDEKLIQNLAQKIEILLSDDKLIESMGKESYNNSRKLNLDNYYNNFYNLIK